MQISVTFGSLIETIAVTLLKLACRSGLFLSCIAAIAVVALSPTSSNAGDIYITGHDIDVHRGQNGYDQVIIDYLRDTIPESSYKILIISEGGGSWTGGGIGFISNYPATVTVNPSSLNSTAAWHSAIYGSGNTPLYDCIVVRSFIAGVAASNMAVFGASEVQAAFNQGTDLWVNSGLNDPNYYNVLPPGFITSFGAIPGNPASGFFATPFGASLGITGTMMNGFPTHNHFPAFDTTRLMLTEEHRDSSGTPDFNISLCGRNISFGPECTFTSENILCRIGEFQPTEDFVVNGTFTNLQDIPGTHILLPPDAISPDGVELCFGGISFPFGEFGTTQVLQLDMPLNNGDSFEIGANPSNEGAIIIKNALPGDEVCFRLVLLGDNGVECCTVEVCFEMPPCDCLQVDRRHDQISEGMCSFDNLGNFFISFDYTFQLTNLFGQDVYHAFLAPLGTETFFPDYFDLELINVGPVDHGQSVELMTRIGTTNLPAGEVVNFLITIHNEDFSECCSREHSVVIPEGCVFLPVTKNLPGDVNEDGVVDLSDVQPFVDLFNTGGFHINADVNQDGVVNLLDVGPFVAILSGG